MLVRPREPTGSDFVGSAKRANQHNRNLDRGWSCDGVGRKEGRKKEREEGLIKKGREGVGAKYGQKSA